MNIVYLLYSYSGWGELQFVEGIYSSYSAAKEKQQEIENKTTSLKKQLLQEKGVDYDEHLKRIEDDSDYFYDEDEKIQGEITLFQAKHRELNINRFEIEERELI